MTAIQTLAGSKDELENRLIAEINRLREESKDTYEGFKNRVEGKAPISQAQHVSLTIER